MVPNILVVDLLGATFSIVDVRNIAGATDTGLAARDVVEGGIVSRGSRAILRRCCARRISPCLIFQAAAASSRADWLKSHH